MKINSKSISLIVIFAALYAVGVVFLAPISFSIYQVRLADALLPLSIIFGLPCALGFGLGALVSNIYGGFGIIDIIGGSLANLIACSIAWYVAKGKGVNYRFLGTLIQTSIITIIVGGYLALLFGVPLEIGFVGVLIGSVIAINVLGFLLLELISRKTSFAGFVVNDED